MEQDKSVQHMMVSVKKQEFLPAKFHQYVRELLMEMYVVGWEQGRMEINEHANKPIAQINEDGVIINIFKSRMEAAKKTHVSKNGIYKSMVGNRFIKGFKWKYLEPNTAEVLEHINKI